MGRLEHAAERTSYDHVKYLEDPIADIQLFGNKKQIDLAQKFASEMAEKGTSSLNELLKELRKDLKLQLTQKEIRYLRINSPETKISLINIKCYLEKLKNR